ncbi:hypothetical protein SAMN05421747_103149 [Parapedobacter composti]|uniref:Uncharacterized protein n=1 Tax=Parapedobacter composti TaxID=623281 RepID=A0A1I1FU89_9SPHI|nr:hypothetical protein [Parapedobacter composti]SFC02612.1 hypothetical protein SAMN05421747_103149 [Parapedobacter composti]
MKKLIKRSAGLLLLAMAVFGCSPEDFDLGAVDVKPEDLVPGLAFTIEHDSENPNIVYLTSLMDKRYTPLWEHPQGRSQDARVTLRIPFEGIYEVRFGVQTRGGAVYGEPVTFTIDEFYAGFVEHELWTLLTGGIGQSKTWIHDNGQYGLASGELDYADPSTTVEWNNFTPNWSPGRGHTGDPNIWESSMTFSLKDGAFYNVTNKTADGAVEQSGTFMLDMDNHTLTITGADLMHTQGWHNKTTNWSRGLKLLTLTENQLRVAVLREEISGESEWWLIWNFVAKEYADNYVPEERPDPVPPIDGNGQDVISTTRTKTWVLSPETPYDWADLEGNLLNNFSGPEAYLSSEWAAYNLDMINATKLTFSALSATTGRFVFTSYDGEPVEGEYTVDQNNDIDFGQPLNAVISESDFGWISTMRLGTSAENKLRIVKTKADAFGNVTDMWLGQRSAEKEEYMVFHFVIGSGGGSTDPLQGWKSALAGKTFKPDVNWFVDWVGFPPGFEGGWTSASTFGNDFTSNSWVWDANVRAVAESASLRFFMAGDQMKVELIQTKAGQPHSAVGSVNIDTENNILNIDIPLVDYAGTVAGWLGTTNDKSITGSTNDWYFVPHGGSNLSNIATNGFWLGRVANSTAAGDDNDEILIFHYVLVN